VAHQASPLNLIRLHSLEPDNGLATAVISKPRNAGTLFGRTVEDSDRGLFNWAWPLIGIEKFDVPVPTRGQQGFWRWTPSPSM
jgi:hypothetical protein